MRFFACRWTRSRLPLLAGDDLVGPSRRQVERHLVGCPDCRLRLAALRGALAALHDASAIDPIPAAAPLWPDLSRQIREARRPAPSVWARLLVVPAAAAVAASLMLALGAAWSATQRGATAIQVLGAPRTVLTNVLPAQKRVPVRPDVSPQRSPTRDPKARRHLEPPDYAIGIPPKPRRSAAGAPQAPARPQPILH